MKGFAKKFCFLLLVICLTLCSTGLAAGAGENTSNTDIFKKGNSNKPIRIALCHLDVAQGPQAENIKKIEKAIHIAGRHGANWIVTPETALQGYYFFVIDPKQKEKIKPQPSEDIGSLTEACKKYGAYFFLGAGEYDKQADCYRNSCLVFGPDGKLMGRHSKMTAHVGFGAEVWSTNDYKLNPVTCSDVTTGILVCSDIWFPSYPVILADKGAKIIIDIAAWPPAEETGNPLPSWELASRRANLPVVICNQTGKPRWMDMTPGQSAVVENGKARLLHSGEEAVLLFDWDPETGKVVSDKFESIPF
ncbi:MAG: carbon-nitrogen hydrolase family protein [Acidaminococcaceae bacterium]|nr:carbon-nitrogen hydrolase family protein [Acidaminococcaceae bacterium]